MNGWSLPIPKPDEKLAWLDPFAPHENSVFEGYYFRVDLPSGAVLAIILVTARPKRVDELKAQRLHRVVSYLRGEGTEECPCRDGSVHQNVPPAPDNHKIMLTYFPGHRNPSSPTHIMVEPTDMQMVKSADEREMAAGAFSVLIPGIGEMTVGPRPHSYIRLDLSTSDFQVFLETRSRLSWSGKMYNDNTHPHHPDTETGLVSRIGHEFNKLWNRGKDWLDTPAGWISMLPGMPLYWHVHSVASIANFRLLIPKIYLPMEDRAGTTANVHAQSNWGDAFPSRHIWIHAHKKGVREMENGIRMEGDEWLMVAGGDVMHTQSFLIGYRGIKSDIYFRPPSAFSISEYGKGIESEPCGFSRSLGKVTQYSPLRLKTDISWAERRVTIVVKSLREKIYITATAPQFSFVPMATPIEDGTIQPNGVVESMRAEVKVQVYKRPGIAGVIGDWLLSEEEVFQNAALEFGGQYYEDRNSGGPLVDGASAGASRENGAGVAAEHSTR